MVRDISEHQQLVQSLLKSATWPHPAPNPYRIETHISSVLLAGDYVYKIKKPVDFGFLDHSTLARRRTSCEEEVRLNRRLAPDIYLGAIPITGTLEAPVLGGEGEPIEWAVRMRRFDEGLLLSLHPELLSRGLMERLGADLARFHAGVAVSQREDPCGQPDLVIAPMRQNFEQVRVLEHGDEMLARLALLEEWTEAQYAALQPRLAARKADGFVREGHGDLHLGNIAMAGSDPIIFDGIEFSCTLRCIDVMNDVAFLVMDLEHRSRPDLAAWFISAYLEQCGDYEGLPLLRFYMVYRAMVRAKVAALRLQQASVPPEKMKPLHAEFLDYVALAERLAEAGRGALLVTHGVSGAGKTVVSGDLTGPLGAVRIRSDVERKRLAGMAADARTGSGQDAGLYAPAVTEATYARLGQAAAAVLQAGRVAIVDATFLRRDRRRAFANLARQHEVPFAILDFEVPERVLRERVARRAASGRDASEADLGVLAAQLARREPLDDVERDRAIEIGPDEVVEVERIRQLIR